ncbi:MAG: hypothetical protein HRT35_30595 [Algicola sp.]|nr:hypothetical protein [Algicola sp.]
MQSTIGDTKVGDIAKTEAAVAVLALALKSGGISAQDIQRLRYARAMALLDINFERIDDLKLIDINQGEIALADFMYLLGFSSGAEQADLHYQLGHVALWFLEQPTLAYEHWLKCGEALHAGCMNILAGSYFDGEDGLPVDMAKSAMWHNKVYALGTKSQCAAAFSANSLAHIAFFFPAVNTGDSWQNWIVKRGKMEDAVSKKLNTKFSCHGALAPLWDAAFFYQNGELDQAQLEKITKSTEIDSLVDLLNKVNDKDWIELANDWVDDIFDIDDNSGRCHAIFPLILFAKKDKNQAAFKSFDIKLNQFDPDDCLSELSIMRQLQMQGKWDIAKSR